MFGHNEILNIPIGMCEISLWFDQFPLNCNEEKFHRTCRGTNTCIYIFPIAPKLDRHLGSRAADVPVKCQSDEIIWIANLPTLKLYDILR